MVYASDLEESLLITTKTFLLCFVRRWEGGYYGSGREGSTSRVRASYCCGPVFWYGSADPSSSHDEDGPAEPHQNTGGE